MDDLESKRRMGGWIGVDLDGVLARYEHAPVWDGSIGPPVPVMVDRVKGWLAEGREVRIMTARVAHVTFEDGVPNDPRAVENQRYLIEKWSLEHLGVVLPITAQKDYWMVEMWDDRCVQVVVNTGFALQELPAFADVIEALKETAKVPA